MTELKNDPLMEAPEPVFRVWRARRTVEVEAVHLFAGLARSLKELWGPKDEVSKLAQLASEEEREHVGYCTKIIDYAEVAGYPVHVASENPVTDWSPYLELGPKQLSPIDKTLYACVAVSCITETLSTALLIEMLRKASPGIIRHTIHNVLTDEVKHSRIGWAELARQSKIKKVNWISFYLDQMIKSAIQSDIGPILTSEEANLDLSSWGILRPQEAEKIISNTLRNVIMPGLAKYGIAVSSNAHLPIQSNAQ